MSILKPLIWTLTKDPYWVGLNAHQTSFLWKNTYLATTDVGFKVKYTLTCDVYKVDHEEFRAARMLEEPNQRQLVDEWHKDVLLPKFKELGYSFKYLSAWNQWDYGNPIPCWVAKEGGEDFIFYDHNCFELSEKLRELPWIVNRGCRAKFFSLKLERVDGLIRDNSLMNDHALIKENYNMIKVRGLKSPENSEQFRTWEETVIVTLLHRHMELQQEFCHIQANQEYKSKMISVKTRLVGSAVELSWELSGYRQDGCVLRGYRREEGFARNDQLGANGMCVVETSGDKGDCVQNLKEDREYFYAFLLTKDEPVYAKQTFLQSLTSTAAVERINTNILDSLRFSIRVPTRAELMRVDRMLERLKMTPDSNREKFERMFKELSEFVEFDESLSQWEKDLINRISESENYTPDEKAEKIDRLKGVIGSIRIASEPMPKMGN